MNNQKQIRWNRTLFSAASLVLWCLAAGQFGLVIDQIFFSGLVAEKIYPAGWVMILGSACLVTANQVSFGQLLKPSARAFCGLVDCWPEWVTLAIVLAKYRGVSIEWRTVIALAGGVLCEEAVFRMMFCTFCVQKDSTLDPKTIVFVSSVIWGAAHLPNILAGVPMIMVAWQCISAAGIGLLLGMVFLKTGSVWPMFFVHLAHNLTNSSIDSNRLYVLVAPGGFSWKIKLVLTIWIMVWIVWIYIFYEMQLNIKKLKRCGEKSYKKQDIQGGTD